MATAPQESGTGRTPGYIYLPEDTWWRLRKLFQEKGAPKPSWNEDYVMNMELRQNRPSARNLVRPFKRMGLFTDDGKPTPRFWDWLGNDKYAEVCVQILHELYPEDLTHNFTIADVDTRGKVERWFQRNQGVNPKVAGQYATLYMLLVEADPSKQDDATAPRSPRTPKVTASRPGGSKSRPSGAGTHAASSRSQQARSEAVRVEQNGHDNAEPHDARHRVMRGFEPSLNINIQIHISAEATSDQIEQIFKSMAKHLYQRQDEYAE